MNNQARPVAGLGPAWPVFHALLSGPARARPAGRGPVGHPARAGLYHEPQTGHDAVINSPHLETFFLAGDFNSTTVPVEL